MRVKIQGVKEIAVKGEYIKLDSLLKFTSVVSTGGEAKILITDGAAFVNGSVCVERGRKIRNGDIVRCGASVFKIVCANSADKGKDDG